MKNGLEDLKVRFLHRGKSILHRRLKVRFLNQESFLSSRGKTSKDLEKRGIEGGRRGDVDSRQTWRDLRLQVVLSPSSGPTDSRGKQTSTFNEGTSFNSVGNS